MTPSCKCAQYSFTRHIHSQAVKKRYEARGGRIRRIAERIVERTNVNPDGPSISFNNSGAEK